MLERVAAGIVWLACRGLLYTDLRGPNVLVAAARGDEGDGEGEGKLSGTGAATGIEGEAGAGGELHVLLVDYDDCIALDAPTRSAAEFHAALVAAGAAAAGPDCFATRFVSGACPDVVAALERAFEAVRPLLHLHT